jgi:hypothetical protein
MKKIFLIGLLVITSFVFYSCGPSEITVSSRPDRPYYDRPVSPGSSYVWIEGDWVARGGRYRWREGHWARSTRVWVSGGWESRGNGWYWRRGHWQ